VLTAPGEALDAPLLSQGSRSQETCRSTRRASPGLSRSGPQDAGRSTIRTWILQSLRNTCRSRCEPTGSPYSRLTGTDTGSGHGVLAGAELEGLNEMDISMDRASPGGLLRGYPYNCPDTRSH